MSPPPSYQRVNHLLTFLAVLSLFSFAGIGDKQNEWFWLSWRFFGLSCGVTALYGYQEYEKNQELNDENTRMLDAVGEAKQGHEWEKYQMSLAHMKEIESLQATIAHLHQQLEQAEIATFDQIETAKERLALEAHRLEQERDQLTQEKALLDEHWQRQQDELAAREEALADREANYQGKLEEYYRAKLDEVLQKEIALETQEREMLKGFEQEWAQREQVYGGIADAAFQEAAKLKQPDYPQGHTHEELLAGEAIRCLYENGVIAKQPHVKPLPNGRFELIFTPCPVLANGETSTPMRSLTEAYKKIERDLIKPLRVAVRGCCSDPLIEPAHNGIKLIFDVSGTDWDAIEQERKAQTEKVHDPDPSHLFTLIQSSPHLCLMGDTGEGKTTLIDNVIALMQQELGDEVALVGINPKPTEDTDLTLLKYSTFETAIFGLLEAIAEIVHRLHLKDEAVQERREVPSYPFPRHQPIIYFFDEFSELVGVWNKCKPDVMEQILHEFEQSLPIKKRDVMMLIRMRVSPNTFVTDLLKFCWRVGRSEAVKILIAGQNLKAGVLGVNIQDLQQLPFIYLGAAIKEGLENRIHKWQKDFLDQEQQHRGRLVAVGKATPFYGLFVPKGNKLAYFATLPAPRQYTAPLTTPTAPDFQPPAPGDRHLAPTDPETVQELERLWTLDCEPIDTATSPATSPVYGQNDPLNGENFATAPVAKHDPFDPENSRELINLVLSLWDAHKSQGKVIEQVWGTPKAGNSKGYRAARWKFRRILKKHDRPLPGKPWGKDPDDSKNFNEIIK